MTEILSGRAGRIGSDAFFQLLLRTSDRLLPGVYDRTLYGPEENGRLVYLAPVSLSAFTGEPVGIASICSKSPLGLARLKTMVLSSGVWIPFRPSLSLDLSLYGPLYSPLGSRTWRR
ncbi:hypothetical protein SANTM175S_01638 [Streptomyces antimycoticus]